MRPTAAILIALLAQAGAGEAPPAVAVKPAGAAAKPAEAPGADPAPGTPEARALLKDLEPQFKTMREELVKGDPELAGLKADLENRRRLLDEAIEAKVLGDQRYVMLRDRIDRLRRKRPPEEPAPVEAPPAVKPKF